MVKIVTKNYLSIDIGGTNIKYGILNIRGEMLQHDHIKTPKSDLPAFMTMINKLIATVADNLAGIAISAPGKVDPQSGCIYGGGALPFLDGVNFKEQLQTKYNCSVAVENDGKAAALAELWLGTLHNINTGAVLVLGTGIGGGIIVDGQLLRGAHWQAGEVSYMILSPYADKVSQIAGYHGSAVAMIERCAHKLQLSNQQDGLAVFEAVKAHDERIMPIFNEYCDAIATIILNLQTVIDVQRIAIGGGISAQPLLIKGIQNAYLSINERIPLIAEQLEPVEIMATHFHNNSNLYGALYNLLLQNKVLKK